MYVRIIHSYFFSCCILTGVYFEKISKEKTVYSGDKVDLSIDLFCQGPVTFTCQWYFNGLLQPQPIAPDDPDYDGSQTTTLIINECQSKHRGYYRCVVTSDANNAPASCETWLTVHRGMLSTIICTLSVTVLSLKPLAQQIRIDTLTCSME